MNRCTTRACAPAASALLLGVLASCGPRATPRAHATDAAYRARAASAATARPGAPTRCLRAQAEPAASEADPPEAALRGDVDVRFDDEPDAPPATTDSSPGTTDAAQRAVRDAIVALQGAWFGMDRAAYLSRVAADATRMPGQLGAIQRGRAAIAAALPDEWVYHEQRGGRLASHVRVRGADITVEGSVATALYWLDVDEGRRWHADDRWLVFQTFARRGARWLLTHETYATDLDDGPSARDAQSPTFRFDFAYPVQDLARAVAFYAPILGAPVERSAAQATFDLRGARFVLRATPGDPRFEPRAGRPNGYALIDVADLATAQTELRARGVRFATDAPAWDGPDALALAFDPAQNVLLLREARYERASTTPPAEPALAGDDVACAAPTRALLRAWLHADTEGASALLDDGGAGAVWFDDTRGKVRAFARGTPAVRAALAAQWSRYDRSSAGLAARASVTDLRVRALGTRALVTYGLALESDAPHAARDLALVTEVWRDLEGPRPRVERVLRVRSNRTGAMALSLDYTGYPADDLRASARFYTRDLRLGYPYRDEGYYGYWSVNSVFGVYSASLESDGVPEAGRANGYVSFWVASAADTYQYLQRAGATFPVIPAINGRPGLDPQPGYTQVVATDSEGNVVLFTQYSGR